MMPTKVADKDVQAAYVILVSRRDLSVTVLPYETVDPLKGLLPVDRFVDRLWECLEGSRRVGPIFDDEVSGREGGAMDIDPGHRAKDVHDDGVLAHPIEVLTGIPRQHDHFIEH